MNQNKIINKEIIIPYISYGIPTKKEIILAKERLAYIESFYIGWLYNLGVGEKYKIVIKFKKGGSFGVVDCMNGLNYLILKVVKK